MKKLIKKKYRLLEILLIIIYVVVCGVYGGGRFWNIYWVWD